MLNKKEVAISLDALKLCRERIVSDFLEESPEIFEPSYRYENSPKLFDLSKDKYFLGWVSNHWSVFNHTVNVNFHGDEKLHAEAELAKIFLEFIKKWSLFKVTDSSQLNLGLSLVEEMECVLQKFIEAGEKSSMLHNKLTVAMEKNRVIFERKIKLLEVKI